jgi:hypothetical protein
MRAVTTIFVILAVFFVSNAYAQISRDSRLENIGGGGVGVRVSGDKGKGKWGFVSVNESREVKEHKFRAGKEVYTDGSKPLVVDMKKQGSSVVYLDAVQMDMGGKTYSPVRVMADGKDVTKKLKDKDLDLVGFKNVVIEFAPTGVKGEATITFLGTANNTKTRVVLPTGNSEPQIRQSSKFYKYTLGSKKGKLKLDGQFTPEEKLGRPNFKERIAGEVGTKAAPLKIWIGDDSEFLFVRLDVASDNTISDSDDSAIMYVRGDGQMATFRAGMNGGPYGAIGNAYTNSAKHEHRVYEFRVPMDKLPKTPDEKLGFAFAVTM